MDKIHEVNHSVLEANLREASVHTVTVLGHEFIVRPGVFSPKYFEDPEFFALQVLVHPGESFLELGCGHGAVSVLKALEGAGPVVATDIIPNAVRTTRDNATKHRVAVDVRQGNLYDPLESDERFDVIFGNLPYNYVPEGTELTLFEQAFYDPGYRTMTRFIGEAPDRLNHGGRLYVGFSPELGETECLHALLDNAEFTYKVVARMKAQSQDIHFELYEARLTTT